MFIFLLQLRDTVVEHRRHIFTIFVVLVWVTWLSKVVLSRRYRPFKAPYSTTASVVVPVVDEPQELFREVLLRIVAQGPDEVIVVINGPRNPTLERICDELDGVRQIWTEVAGKRNAVRIGTEAASGEIVVLVDSDTIWTRDTLPELLKPFADPTVGGVTTRQRILAPHRHVLTRWADWMESVRNLYSMPAMSSLGTVGCLPGRTIAFRRSVLSNAMPAFLHARFLGVFLEVSDDRTLTNEALKQGYRTVYQATSLVYTDAPTTWRKSAKQQFRWARGSQYNTLRMLPWMLRNARTLAFFYIVDIVGPFLLLATLIGWGSRSVGGGQHDLFAGFAGHHGKVEGLAILVGLTVVAALMSFGIRHARHLRRQPTDFLRLPAFVVMSTFFLMPIRMLGFVRMAHAAGWGTRAGGYQGEETKSPLVVIPYLLAALLLVAGTLYQS
jgi:hyaluronan synthase